MKNRIRELREQRKLTQAELGRLLEIDETAVSRWESGARPLTPTVLTRLAKAFKVETWEVLVNRDGLRRLAAQPGDARESKASENQTRRTAKVDPSDAEKGHDAF
jgi:XRE family transcriptional regulator, fatty acid utilization regulator